MKSRLKVYFSCTTFPTTNQYIHNIYNVDFEPLSTSFQWLGLKIGRQDRLNNKEITVIDCHSGHIIRSLSLLLPITNREEELCVTAQALCRECAVILSTETLNAIDICATCGH